MKRLTLSFPWPLSSRETDELLAFTFEVSFILYAAFVVAEFTSPGIVQNHLDIRVVFWIMLFLGILSSAFPSIGQLGQGKPMPLKRRLLMPLPYAIFAGYLTILALRGYEAPSLVLSVGSGIVVYIVLLWSSHLVSEDS